VTDPVSGERRRSLHEDLLADLQQSAHRIPISAVGPVPERRAPVTSTEQTSTEQAPTVELRITPRSWSAAGWTALPQGSGFVVSVGPVRLSLGLRRD
jgi:hypothetical protein